MNTNPGYSDVHTHDCSNHLCQTRKFKIINSLLGLNDPYPAHWNSIPLVVLEIGNGELPIWVLNYCSYRKLGSSKSPTTNIIPVRTLEELSLANLVIAIPVMRGINLLQKLHRYSFAIFQAITGKFRCKFINERLNLRNPQL